MSPSANRGVTVVAGSLRGRFAVVHKPPGLPVHARGMNHDSLELRLAAALTAARRDPPLPATVHFANRLDAGTRGLCVVAFDTGTKSRMALSMGAGTWHKRYRVLVDTPPCVDVVPAPESGSESGDGNGGSAVRARWRIVPANGGKPPTWGDRLGQPPPAGYTQHPRAPPKAASGVPCTWGFGCRFQSASMRGRGLVCAETGLLHATGELESWMARCEIHGSRSALARDAVEPDQTAAGLTLPKHYHPRPGEFEYGAPRGARGYERPVGGDPKRLARLHRFGQVLKSAAQPFPDGGDPACTCRAIGAHRTGYIEHPYYPESLMFESVPPGTGGGAKHAVLEFTLLGPAPGRRLLYDVRLVTGRTHQIRVQFSDAGFAVTNDAIYNPAVVEKLLRTHGDAPTALETWADDDGGGDGEGGSSAMPGDELRWPHFRDTGDDPTIRGMGLQAYALSFPDPNNSNSAEPLPITCELPVPEDWSGVVEAV